MEIRDISALPHFHIYFQNTIFDKEVDDTIFDLPKILQGEMLTIDGCQRLNI